MFSPAPRVGKVKNQPIGMGPLPIWALGESCSIPPPVAGRLWLEEDVVKRDPSIKQETLEAKEQGH